MPKSIGASTAASLPTLLLLTVCAIACGDASPPTATSTVSDAEARTYALAIDTPFAELVIPAQNRPDGTAPPERIPLQGWKHPKSTQHAVRLPVRTRNLFFHRPPPGMGIVDAEGNTLLHKSSANGRKPYWTFDQDSITFYGEMDPGDDDYFLVYPRAVEREASLNHEYSGKDETDFVRTYIQAGPDYRGGLLIPAPGHVAWDLTVPPAAELHFAPGLVMPEISEGGPSDGVDMRAEVDVDGQTHEVWSARLTTDSFERVNIDLAKWSGQDVRLRFVSDPRANNRYDYAFLSEPVLASRRADPRRVIMIFVDTLRPDHLSPYGYERDTSPATQRIAEQGVVFEAARSVAPWTLPSARSTLTGRHPEYFETSPTLQGRLRGEGWATAMFAGNLYLGANFDMNKDWGLHHVVLWPSATEQVDGALAWLEEHKGRDSLMLLHFMDAHLPYQEPGDYRRLFAGDPPETLTKEEFHRNHVLKAKLRTPEDRQYVRDRYDNNIRYVDDELNRLYEYLDEDDIIVYFSDHGEEFWDHKGYEHGHTLFDELLRVPLIVRAPSLDAGRVSEPVSLLDVTPTVLDLLDMEAAGLDGVSLVAAAKGAECATEALAKRDLAFGRPLYGSERWGVLHGDEKYTLNEGREALYRIGDDPNERNNIFSKLEEDDPGAEYRPLLGDALGREMVTGYRLWTTWLNRASDDDTVARLTVPGGIAAAFVGSDPTLNSHASVQIDGEVATITWTRGYRGSREVWVVPSEPMENVTTQLTAQIEFGDQRGTIDVPDTKSGTLPKVRVPLGRAQVGGRTVLIGYGIAPSPDDEMNEISGYDDELAEQLKAMGYVFDDE